MIKVILFDFGNVLGSEANVLALDTEVAKKTGLSEKTLLETFAQYWDELKVGKKDLDAYHQAIVEKATKPITLAELHRLHIEKIWISSEILALAKVLRHNGYRVMILSNESKQGIAEKKKKFSLLDTFEKIYTSAEIGIAKPNKKIFEYVIQDLGVEPDEILLIDDWDKNIKAAKSLGMQAIEYKDVTQLKN